MVGNANLWVLDFLLESDGLDDTLIKHFHDVNASQFEELPPNTQARLMLRVLRDAPAQPTGIAEAALGALNMLKNLADQLPENFAPGANLEALKPSSHLFTEVKTELVLKSLRDGNQGEHPRVILDTFFVPPEQGGVLDAVELERRNEILEGLKGPEEAQQLLAKYPVDQLNHTLLSFVAAARAALGPNMLKLVEKDMAEGRYNPHQAFQAPGVLQQGVQAGAKRRRTKGTTTTEEDAAGMLANMSQSTAALAGTGGQDPLTDAMQAAQGTVKPDPSQLEQIETSEGGTPRPILQPAQGGIPAPLGGTPVSSPNPEQARTNTKQPGQPSRRRNGRWNEEETNFLIRMVRELGKGKWKRILEQGGELFQNRSQVDLKDKWRNLERQGVVGPHDLPPQPIQQLAGQVQNVAPPQLGADGNALAPTLVGPNGEPLTEAQAHHYAQQLAQHAASLGYQAFPAELAHQMLASMAHGQPLLQQQQQQQQMQQHVQGEEHPPPVHAGEPQEAQPADVQQAEQAIAAAEQQPQQALEQPLPEVQQHEMEA